jgi:hypothetical protein
MLKQLAFGERAQCAVRVEISQDFIRVPAQDDAAEIEDYVGD